MSRNEVLYVISEARRTGRPLGEIAKEQGVQISRIKKYAPDAITKKHGRLFASRSDAEVRAVMMLTAEGQQVVIITGRGADKRASDVARYQQAVDVWLQTGDESLLAEFKGKTLWASGKQWPYIIDPKLLRALADAGELHFESFYEFAA